MTPPRLTPPPKRVRSCAGRRRRPQPGTACPRCRRGRLAYDGLVQLSCPRCGYVADAGAFT